METLQDSVQHGEDASKIRELTARCSSLEAKLGAEQVTLLWVQFYGNSDLYGIA